MGVIDLKFVAQVKVVIFRFHVNFQGCNEGRLDIIDLYLLKVIVFTDSTIVNHHFSPPFGRIRSIFPSIEEWQFRVNQLLSWKVKDVSLKMMTPILIIILILFWAIYNDLSRGHPKR